MRRIAIIAYLARPDAVSGVRKAVDRLTAAGVEVIVGQESAGQLDADLAARCRVRDHADFEKLADMVMTFGGDGTLLAAARMLMGTDVPIMGVNVGKLGFLAEFSMAELDEAIDSVITGSYRVVDRTTIEVEVAGTRSTALNEILLERSSKAKMISVRTWVDEHHVADYRADGVIVATPTGSTAYSLAAGGPIIAPSTNSLCITPIAPHTLTLRPLIINDTSEVRMHLMSDATQGQVVADGLILGTVSSGESVTIRKGPHLVKLVKRIGSTYYDLLRQKLLWAADATSK